MIELCLSCCVYIYRMCESHRSPQRTYCLDGLDGETHANVFIAMLAQFSMVVVVCSLRKYKTSMTNGFYCLREFLRKQSAVGVMFIYLYIYIYIYQKVGRLSM